LFILIIRIIISTGKHSTTEKKMPNDSSQLNYTFGQAPQTFCNFGTECRSKVDNLISFESGIDRVRQLENDWKCIDSIQPLKFAHIDFTGSEVSFTFRNKKSIGKEARITRHALKQIANYIQPRTMSGRKVSMYNSTEATCLIDNEFRKLSTIQWSKLMGSSSADVLFRSKVIDGIRTITSVQSQKYAPIFDSQVLAKLQERNPSFKFANAYVSSVQSNFRLLEARELTLNDPVDMYDLHNSGSGLRGLHLFLKAYLLVCTNGMVTSNTKNSFYRRHFGDREFILNQFADKIEEMKGGNEEFLAMYRKARTVGLNNLWETLLYRLQMTDVEKEDMMIASSAHSLIASPINTLGHAVDTITLAAQKKSDPFERHLLECKATDFMTLAFEDIIAGKALIPQKLLA